MTTPRELRDTVGAADNPKHAAGKKKTPLSLIPPAPSYYVGLVHKHGADKYGPFNWAEHGVVASIYYDAARRHLDAWFTGQELDPESGLPHLAHVIACMNILLDCHLLGNVEDDRPKNSYSVGRILDLLGTHSQPIPDEHADTIKRRLGLADEEQFEHDCNRFTEFLRFVGVPEAGIKAMIRRYREQMQEQANLKAQAKAQASLTPHTGGGINQERFPCGGPGEPPCAEPQSGEYHTHITFTPDFPTGHDEPYSGPKEWED